MTPTISAEIVREGGPKNLSQSDYFKGDQFVTKLKLRAPETVPENAPETNIDKDSNGDMKIDGSNGVIYGPFCDSNVQKLTIKSDSNGRLNTQEGAKSKVKISPELDSDSDSVTLR